MSIKLDHRDDPPIFEGITKPGKPPGHIDPNIEAIISFSNAVQFLVENLTLYARKASNYIKIADPSTFKQEATYSNFDGDHLTGSREITPQIDIAVGTIKNPLVVFRDVLQNPESRESTQTEHYIGLTEFVNGDPAMTYVFVHRNLMHSVKVVRFDNIDNILTELSGLPIHQKKV